jgi:hypothetical protein
MRVVLAGTMAAAASRNIEALMADAEAHRETTWNAGFLADFGNDGVEFIALPQNPAAQRQSGGPGLLGACSVSRFVGDKTVAAGS